MGKKRLTTFVCDFCGTALPAPSRIRWSYYPPLTHEHTQRAYMLADGMYCSQSCQERDTTEAKCRRRARTKWMEANYAA